MPYPIEEKLVVGLASSALYDLSEADSVFRGKGESAYREYQRAHVDEPLPKGVAFPFIRRLLNLNRIYPQQEPIEVILLSRNDPDTGLRVMRSIAQHDLDITRGAFLTGRSPHDYLGALNVSLFLSADEANVRSAIDAGFPAGLVLKGNFEDDESDRQLRIAFDFDGVVVDDEAETVFGDGDLLAFQEHELAKSAEPHAPGPLLELLKRISEFQKMERKKALDEPGYEAALRIAVVTARNAPSHERYITTMRKLGIDVDETFFLGGIEKRRVLEVFKPHMFFDDQMAHLDATSSVVPSVHVPFGIRNHPTNSETT